MAEWLIYSCLPHDESVWKRTWHTRSGGDLHRTTLLALCYYAAVLLRGDRVCRPLVLVAPHSQSTGRTPCIVLYTHFRSINVLSVSLSTWSCDIHQSLTQWQITRVFIFFKLIFSSKLLCQGCFSLVPPVQPPLQPSHKLCTLSWEVLHGVCLDAESMIGILYFFVCLCSFWQSAGRNIIAKKHKL